MEKIWKRYGKDTEKIRKRYGKDMEKIWRSGALLRAGWSQRAKREKGRGKTKKLVAGSLIFCAGKFGFPLCPLVCRAF
jgi:hypothetical protein